MDLNIIWFGLIGVLIMGYAVLDGFDLGVGALYLILGKTQQDRKALLQSIGPFWDGNEVWLLTGAGAIFAAFPLVYAKVFSGFYLCMMLVLLGLIVRAVSIEFRYQSESPAWQRRFDLMFAIGSIIPALLFGVAMGNIALGLPLDSNLNYTGGLLGLLNPYALLLGLLGLCAFVLQGNTYIILKNTGILQENAKAILPKVWLAFIILYMIASIASYLAAPTLFVNYTHHGWMYLAPLLVVFSLALIPWTLKNGRPLLGFIASSAVISGLVATLGFGIFPNLVPAVDPSRSLSIYNASSSQLTLKVMLIIALIGLPLVLFYTAYVYYVFRGKVELDDHGY